MTPALHDEMRAAGSPQAWFAQQLDPAAIDDAEADALQGWWTSIDLDAADHLAARPGRDRGRLGGDGELRPLVPAAPDRLASARCWR